MLEHEHYARQGIRKQSALDALDPAIVADTTGSTPQGRAELLDYWREQLEDRLRMVRLMQADPIAEGRPCRGSRSATRRTSPC